MKIKKLAFLSIIPLLITGCNNPKPQKVEVKMVSHFGEFDKENYTDTCNYSDRWFLEDSSKINYNLAVVSAMVDGASASNELDKKGQKVTDFLNTIGFSNIEMNRYYSEGLSLENSIGAIIGKKTIKGKGGKPYTLLAMFPRNAGYGLEWAGNFNIGSSGVHAGFKLARDEMLRFMKQYITKNEITGDLKVWLAGYSRGAAATNLLGGFLVDDKDFLGSSVNLDSKDLFVYTIGTPRNIPNSVAKSEVLNVSGSRGEGYFDTEGLPYAYIDTAGTVTPTDEKYNCIHNFVATGDYITKLPTQDLDFTRYGKTEEIVYGGEKFISYLAPLSQSTADIFKDGNSYSKDVSLKTFDLVKLETVETNEKKSADKLIEERLKSVFSLVDSREELVESKYAELLGAATAIYGTDFSSFANLLNNPGSLVPAGLYNYFAYVADTLEVSDEEAASTVLMDLMTLMGKKMEDRSTYTDQQFLKDLLDYLINDPQSKDEAKMRGEKLANLIPAPYGALYSFLLNYAKKNSLTATNFDEFLFLLSSFITDNKENPAVDSLVTTLSGMIPEQYLDIVGAMTGKKYDDPTLYPDTKSKAKAIMFDLFECCVNGNQEFNIPAPQFRNTLIMMIGLAVLNKTPTIVNLLLNGTEDGSGKVVKDPAPIKDLVNDILTLLLPVDEEGKRTSFKVNADKALQDLLETGRSEINSKYIDILKENTSKIRDVIVKLLFNPGNEYSLGNDIMNAYSLVDTIKTVFPAHYHELYVSYFKTLLK